MRGFRASKSKFFGLVITDEEIIVKVLESIDEYYNEGKRRGHLRVCSGYYKKADTLILSARIGDEIIETIEGLANPRSGAVPRQAQTRTPNIWAHHRPLNKNANLIRERMKDISINP